MTTSLSSMSGKTSLMKGEHGDGQGEGHCQFLEGSTSSLQGHLPFTPFPMMDQIISPPEA